MNRKNQLMLPTNGIVILGATGTVVQGNLIGTQVDGIRPLGNSSAGIEVFFGSNSIIGGTSSGASNTIAFNGHGGVAVFSRTGNAIRSNSIFLNSGLGIDLTILSLPDGMTLNDPGDADTGANNLQNFPVLTSATSGGGSTTIQGTLNSTANTAFSLDFFSNTLCDPSGFGEGEKFLGSTTVTTDGSGEASFAITFPTSVPLGQFITATATDPSGNTSEFSRCLEVLSPGVFAIRPNKGGNTGFVTMLIRGGGVGEGTTVKLARTDQPDIVGAPVAVGEGGQTITTRFDLTGKVPGLWDVVVMSLDGTAVTLEAAFEIIDGGTGKLALDLVGLAGVRPGRPAKFIAVVRNEGLVDLEFVSVRVMVQADQTNQSTQPLLRSQLAEPLSQAFGIIDVLPPGEHRTVPITVTFPSGGCNWLVNADADIPLESEDCEVIAVEIIDTKQDLERLKEELARTNAIIQQKLDDLQICIELSPLPDEQKDLLLERIEAFVNCHNSPLCEVLKELVNELLPDDCDFLWDDLRTLIKKRTEVEQQIQIASVYLARLRARFEELCTQKSSSTLSSFEVLTTAAAEQAEASLTVCPIFPFDPNYKSGAAGPGEALYVRGTIPLMPYAVFFENLATATAAAQEVLITDQLDANLDWSTFSLDTIRIGEKTIEVPEGTQNFTTTVDLRPAISALVEVNCQFSPSTGHARWLFRGKDPDTGELADFLPPNTEEVAPRGEGMVSYSVKSKQGLPTGTVIKNKATIDFEVGIPPAPIETAEVFNTIDSDAPTSQVLPLSLTQGSPSFEVRWTGTDMGSGILDYTIFVSENGGPFTPFLTNTTATSATFTGQSGKTYAFYSVARDQTGNLEDTPTGPDTTTTILTNRPPVARCQNVTVPADSGVCTASASVNNGSSDPDGDPITLSQSPAGPYSLGTTNVTLTVMDDEGASASCSATVTVVDQQPPTIETVTANPNVLWPPDHKMVPVTVTASASDNCDTAPVCQISSVSSNEPVNGLGDGDQEPDWEITGNLTVNLRAERSGIGNGRVYTITVGCTDASGNSSTKAAAVTVPHDQPK